MSLANIKGKLSRTEMKNIMAGSGCGTGPCTVYDGTRTHSGRCGFNFYACECITDLGYYIPNGGVSHCEN